MGELVSIVDKTALSLTRESAELVLENMLARVRSGDVVAVAMAAVWHDGMASSHWSRSENRNTLIGSVARLQHDLLRGLD